MFTLFVTGFATDQVSGVFDIDRGRFLEYTSVSIKTTLRTFANEAQECLYSWPCLLMAEGRATEIARVVRITSITVKESEIAISVTPLSPPVELTNNEVWKLRGELDLAEFEFSRNHVAVKERDLLTVLGSAGVRIDPSVEQSFVAKPLPTTSRGEILKLRDSIAALSNAEIDLLLMEAGVNALVADKALGSRRNRADAIVKFAIGNPEALTAEKSLFTQFLLKRMKAPAGATADTAAPSAPATRLPNRVFIVHGRNEQARTDVADFLRSIGLEPIILHEQPNMGRHLLTKFIGEAEVVPFAVVLMTDDDWGGLKGDALTLAPRARQNVILELGYFLSHLGQANVCALISPGLETPSDFDGILYVSMAPDGKWKAELLRELRASKMPVVDSRKHGKSTVGAMVDE